MILISARVQTLFGVAFIIVALTGIAFADLGSGGCHSDVYIDNTGDAPTTVMVYCKNVGCPQVCPAAASGPGTGGYVTCWCPSMSGRCNAGWRTLGGGALAFACIWGCNGGLICRDELNEEVPENFAEQGYDQKFTCWCQ